MGGGATPYGRTDYYDISTIATGQNGKPTVSSWLVWNFCTATGHRFNKAREAVSVSGCGYSKPLEIARALANIAGKAIHCYAPGSAFGPNGWVEPSSGKGPGQARPRKRK